MSQLPLELTPTNQLDVQFAAFHAANPGVYEALRRLALRAVDKGRTTIGIGMLWEALRWETFVETVDPTQLEWKLNNSYRSRYARLLMASEPKLRGVFETRRLTKKAGGALL
jgi:hypothetical protein